MDGSCIRLDQAEGSRFVGEAGHFFDVLSFLANSRPVSITATCLRPEKLTRDDLDNVVATVQYENGSVGNILYLTQGASSMPKEYIEIFGGGKAAQLNNFESLAILEGDRKKAIKKMRVDKGQKEELEAFNKVGTSEQLSL